MRLKAFILFGRLAKVVGISKKHFFKGEVKRGWVSLLLHCQDPCPRVAQVTVPSLQPVSYDLGAQCQKVEGALAPAGSVSYQLFDSPPTAPFLLEAGAGTIPGTPKMGFSVRTHATSPLCSSRRGQLVSAYLLFLLEYSVPHGHVEVPGLGPL